MSLHTELDSVFARIGLDNKALNAALQEMATNTGDLSQLSTTAKDSLVAALNEMYATLTGLDIPNAADIATLVNAGIDGLVGNAPGTLDTLGKIATEVAKNSSLIEALEAALVGAVRHDQAQTLADTAKETARTNIGAQDAAQIGDVASANYVGTYNTAKNG